jgi:nucleotide-binding universal stress UspA family protein
MSTSEMLESPAGAAPLPTWSRGAVLIATHGAETSDGAMRWAYTYATRHHLPLDVVATVMPITVPVEYGGSYVDLDRIQREAAQECVTGQLARVINGPLPAITLETGFPVDIVATRASARASGMIVVGRGRQELLGKLLGGETVIGILRRTRTPVLAVASNAGWRPSVVVIATDFSPSATRAAELAVALTGDGATIHLVHVQSAFDRAAADEARETVYAAGARAMFEQLQHRLVFTPGTTVRTHLLSGDPAEMLLQVAREEHADLIATGTHSKGFVGRLTLGSVAEHVLRGAPCSVLVAPDPVA